jgi:alkylation response protein AidB-like acyl-CoA dehydrogenase
MVGGCRIVDADKPRLRADGTQVTRLLFFPAPDCKISDTWHSTGLRGTGSHDYSVADLFVPAEHSLSLIDEIVLYVVLYAFT